MSAILVVTPPHRCNAQLAIAAARAGEVGLLDLSYARDRKTQRSAICALAKYTQGRKADWGIRWDALNDGNRLPGGLGELPELPWPLLLLAGVPFEPDALEAALGEARQMAKRVYLEVYSLPQALRAEEAGFDAVIVKGHESGGRVSQDSTFLLLQQFSNRLKIPYYVQGGIGLDTAAAAFLTDAAGVVLCEQVWLATESPFDRDECARLAHFDGSETAVVGTSEIAYRVFSRADRKNVQDLDRALAQEEDWNGVLRHRLLADNENATVHDSRSLIPLGQDIALAGQLASEHGNVAGILGAYRRRIEGNLSLARRQMALARQGPLAEVHGTEFPILQGPMTRVSDVTAFCERVAENGALPFLALALMQGRDVSTLLTETSDRLAGRPWGVGILGFVPADLRKAQLEAISDVKPPFAIIAGGRPSQAAKLERLNISTYLHVPSPGLLDAFIRDGARKFIFEGRECGGHVGPRGSFVLWQSAIDLLLAADGAGLLESGSTAEEFQIVFAGGIHDALSAAMVATLAAPLVERGMKIGVLMGTGYLFTHEAVESGAITAEFQRQALDCRETILLESGVGHATRCVDTPFAQEFNRVKQDLVRAGTPRDEIRLQLEMLNVGRLRIASKGLERRSDPRGSDAKGEIVHTDVESQRRRGMYMIGQLAALREKPLPMSELHEDVAEGSGRELRRRTSRKLPWRKRVRRKQKQSESIAIVGMAGMFPEAPNARRYWQNILRGLNAVKEVPPERWRAEDFFSKDRLTPDQVYSKWGSFLGDVVFDPMRWGIPPTSLQSIEPIQLLSLLVAWDALVDAGYNRGSFPRARTGVIFAAAGSHEMGTGYCVRTMMRHYLPQIEGISDETRGKVIDGLEKILPKWTEDSFPGFLMNVISGRITNRLDLGGPNFVVDAACAASLAAVHAAIEQLRTRTADAVLVGGADATNNPFCYMSFAKTHALSPRGRSRPLDDSADGIALGETVAAMVLKRLDDAERDGDRIYAVIKGIGSSSDGMHRSMTAPHTQGQVLAIRRAYEDAALSPATVSLIEAHGTGTAVGDLTEINSLKEVFSAETDRRQFAAVGSVKSMIGHTKTAAGMASLVKTTLALNQRVLPPTIGVESPNSKIDFAASPFYVNSQTRPWLAEGEEQPRRAGVSAFGFGGTNFHVVLEEYTGSFHDGHHADLTPRSTEVVSWARPGRERLLRDLDALSGRLAAASSSDDLAQVACSIFRDEAGRPDRERTCRLGIAAGSVDDLKSKIRRAAELLAKRDAVNDPTGIYYSEAEPLRTGQICFLYPGQGSQTVNMLRELCVGCGWSRALFDRVDRDTRMDFEQPLSRYIFPQPAFDDPSAERQRADLNDTRVAQPALGLIELFATELLARYGLRPGMTGGHSYGEYVALCVAGVFSPEDLIRLSAERGRIAAEAAECAPGAMAAVQAGADETVAALRELKIDAAAANLNAPDQTIIAGSLDAIEKAVRQFPRQGLRARLLPVTAAFHTPALRPAAEAFAEFLRDAPIREPRLPVTSNTTAGPFPSDESEIRSLLSRHMIEPVLFEQQIRRMYADGARLFVEVGPAGVLSNLVSRILRERPHTCLSVDAADRSGWEQFAHLLASSTALGLPVTLDEWFDGRGLRDCSLAEHLDLAALASTPKPTDWIIGPSRATPITPLPSANGGGSSKASTLAAVDGPPHGRCPPQAMTGGSGTIPVDRSRSPAAAENSRTDPAAGTARGVVRPALRTENTTLQAGSSTLQPSKIMGPEMSDAVITPSPSRAPSAGNGNNGGGRAYLAAENLPIFQTVMTEWLALQNSQQRVMERFLDIHERILSGNGLSHLPHAIDSPAAGHTGLPRTPTEGLSPAETGMSRIVTERPAGTGAGVASSGAVNPRAVRPPIPVPPHTTQPEPPKVVTVGTPASDRDLPAVTPAGGNGLAAVADDALPTGDTATTQVFRQDLLQAVSERTGYPIDVLDVDVPLESGLGIDSIKTVEIFSKLKQYHYILRDAEDDDEELLAEFASLKTLRHIIDSYDQRRQAYIGSDSVAATSSGGNGQSTAADPASTVRRLTLEAVEAAPAGNDKKKTAFRSITSS